MARRGSTSPCGRRCATPIRWRSSCTIWSDFRRVSSQRLDAIGSLRCPKSAVTTDIDADVAVELSFWDSVKGSDSPELYEAYLENIPQEKLTEVR